MEDAIVARADYPDQIEQENLHPDPGTAYLLRVAGDLLLRYRED